MNPIIRFSAVTTVVSALSLASGFGQAKVEPLEITPSAPAAPAAPAPATPTTPAAPGAPATPTTPGAPVKPAVTSTATNPITEKNAADLLKALRDLGTQLGVAKGKATGAALAAFQAAMTTDDKAYSLFMDCKKKVDFDDKGKTGGEFGEWKRRDDVKALHDPEYTTVLRLQLQWLVLSIQAANATTDSSYATVVAQVPSFLEALHTAWKKMKSYRGELNKDVISTVFSQYYKLDQVMERREGWSYNPLGIDSIYDNVVLPHLRTMKNANAVASSWKNRIQMLTDFFEIEEREAKGNPNSRAEERSINFQEDKLPRLEWGMMKDGFLLGNETSAAVSMLAHIRGHLGHKDAELWISELEKLASHEKVDPTRVGDSVTGQAPEQRGGNQRGPGRK